MSAASPETVARARELYASGVPVSRILAETEFSLGTLYLWLDGGPLENGAPRLPQVPRRRQVLVKRRRALKTDRVSLAARLWRTAERQVRDIEQRLAANQQEPAERERDARVLAVLVRTLRDLAAFDSAALPISPASETDDPPRDLDEFRRELARRMDALVASRAADRVPGEPASA